MDSDFSDIKTNLVYLAEKLTNLDGVLIHLIQLDIITIDDRERIIAEITSLDRNLKLLTLLERKWTYVRETFITVLKNTKNDHCAAAIEGNEVRNKWKQKSTEYFSSLSQKKVSSLLPEKWWPEEKKLTNAFYRRTINDRLMVDELLDILSNNKNGMAVINQKVAVSGLGGIGKTTTAKWFANHFQDNYIHIIWIDCGEKSLIKSFTKLARQLKVKDMEHFELKELAKNCFDLLDTIKILWIFDNAECYRGSEGVRDVLPRNKNFHTIITSRNRDWGNETGYGKISEFKMGTFEPEESVEFLRANVFGLSSYDNEEIIELCNLLGNLPLALQIATGALNRQKIDLPRYVERIKLTDHIINQDFDDYEKTINQTMKISLDLIKNYEGGNGDLAYKILMIFGYITPEDVPTEFFARVENVNTVEIDESADLLEKYSLVTRFSYDDLDIHRLLQQVIRYNERNDKTVILKKIMRVSGFLDYKLIPFTFADQDLKEEFADIQAQLIDQVELNTLMKDRRFREAVEISLIIYDKLKTSTSFYNYIVCLSKNGEKRKALNLLEQHISEHECLISNNEIQPGDLTKLGILGHNHNVNWEIIAGQLFLLYWKKLQMDKAVDIFKRHKKLLLSYSAVESFSEFTSMISKALLSQSFELICNLDWMILKRQEITQPKIVTLLSFVIEDTTVFPMDLEILELKLVDIVNCDGENLTSFNLSTRISGNLKKLTLQNTSRNTHLTVSCDQLQNICDIDLGDCTIELSENRIHPQKIKMQNILFTKNGINYSDILINTVLDVSEVSVIKLEVDDGNTWKLDVQGSYKINRMELSNIKILNWKESMWTVKLLKLENMALEEKIQTNIEQIILRNIRVDFSVLPNCIKWMNLGRNIQGINENHLQFLSELKYLLLANESITTYLHFFEKCTSLKKLDLFSYRGKTQVNIAHIPRSIVKVKIDSRVIVTGTEIRDIDSLITPNYKYSQLQELLTICKPKNLVFSKLCGMTSTDDCKLICELIRQPFESFAVGEFLWKNFTHFEASCLFQHVDKKSNYYVFKNGKGCAVDQSNFFKLLDI